MKKLRELTIDEIANECKKHDRCSKCPLQNLVCVGSWSNNDEKLLDMEVEINEEIYR